MTILSHIDPARLRSGVEELAVLRHAWQDAASLEAVAQRIGGQFAAMGLEPRFEPVRFRGRTYYNILAEIPGRDPSLPGLLLGAHYDGPRGSPGADDNASGVAALLEAARTLALVQPRRTLQFAAFTLEELQPRQIRSLVGSDRFARRQRRAGRSYLAAVILECVGYVDLRPGSQRVPRLLRHPVPDSGDFLAVLADHRSTGLLEDFLAMTGALDPDLKLASYRVPPVLGQLMLPLRFSDHASFWKYGYPALLLTDTAMFRNPHYHTPRDTPETLDYQFLAAVTRAVVWALYNWAAHRVVPGQQCFFSS